MSKTASTILHLIVYAVVLAAIVAAIVGNYYLIKTIISQNPFLAPRFQEKAVEPKGR